MRKPIPPAGFVPVDSDEASTIPHTQFVNQVFISKGKWVYSYGLMGSARKAHENMHYHVQLPPPVEWEEVWGWEINAVKEPYITKNGLIYQLMDNRTWTDAQLDTIVRALNEMEGQ